MNEHQQHPPGATGISPPTAHELWAFLAEALGPGVVIPLDDDDDPADFEDLDR